jgi:hypothetical protein
LMAAMSIAYWRARRRQTAEAIASLHPSLEASANEP